MRHKNYVITERTFPNNVIARSRDIASAVASSRSCQMPEYYCKNVRTPELLGPLVLLIGTVVVILANKKFIVPR